MADFEIAKTILEIHVITFDKKASESNKTLFSIRSRWKPLGYAAEKKARYSEIMDFFKKLSKDCKSVGALDPKLELPGKTWFGNSSSKDFIDSCASEN